MSFSMSNIVRFCFIFSCFPLSLSLWLNVNEVCSFREWKEVKKQSENKWVYIYIVFLVRKVKYAEKELFDYLLCLMIFTFFQFISYFISLKSNKLLIIFVHALKNLCVNWNKSVYCEFSNLYVYDFMFSLSIRSKRIQKEILVIDFRLEIFKTEE